MEETAGRGRTSDLVGGRVDEVFVAEGLGSRALAHAADAGDDVVEGALVQGELATQVLHHGVDVVELGLVAGRGRVADDGTGHVASVHVHAVYGGLLVLLWLKLRRRLRLVL